jgi:tetratricopeptide (TPR) repeat protein
MKATFLLCSLLLFNNLVKAANDEDVIAKAKALVADKKYETAFKLLDSVDTQNQKPDIVLLKEDIVLNYFVSSIMHQMFSLKDLKKNENIMDYRGKEGTTDIHYFEVDKVLDTLIKQYPENCKLYKGLGDFYYEVDLKYGVNWMDKGEELYKLMETNFTKATQGGCGDYLSYYILGYSMLTQKKYKESITPFLKSIELNKEYPSSHYNLAYAYLYADEREKALQSAAKSLELYQGVSYKSDAARMMAVINAELGKDKESLSNYELANKIEPGNYYNLKPLVNIYLKNGSPKATQVTKEFFLLGPTKPTIYDDLEDIFTANKKIDALTAFYKTQLDAFKTNNQVLGSLYFFLARIYMESDKKQAKEYFLNAKDSFAKVFKSDNGVFKAIDEGIKKAEE